MCVAGDRVHGEEEFELTVTVREEWCKGCGMCILNCPKEAIYLSRHYNSSGYATVEVDCKKCVFCGNCYTVCPDVVFEIREEV